MYKKRTYKKRRKPYRRYKRKTSLAKDVAMLKKQVKQNRPELQAVDYEAGTVAVSPTPVIIKLGNYNSHTRCTFKSIQLNVLVKQMGISNNTQTTRLVLFTVKNSETEAMPIWDEIYKTGTGTNAILALRKIDSDKDDAKNFRILMDKRINTIMDTDGSTNNSKFVSIYKKLNLPTIVASDGSYFTKGGLYLAHVGSSTNVITLDIKARTRYVTHSDN